MRLSDPIAIGDLVTWNDPRAPKKGPRLARVLDVAGPWALIRPEFDRRQRSSWILTRRLVSSPSAMSPHQKLEGLLKQAGVLPLEEGDPPLLPEVGSPEWLKCLVCTQPLHRLRVQTEPPRSTEPVKKWMYCLACDRVQRLP